jgi:hypothetical protein
MDPLIVLATRALARSRLLYVLFRMVHSTFRWATVPYAIGNILLTAGMVLGQ